MRKALNIILFGSLLLSLSCKKKEDDPSQNDDPAANTTTTPAPESASSTPFVRFDVDGATVQYTEGSNNVSTGVSNSKQLAVNTSTNPSRSGYGCFFSGKTQSYFSFNKGTITFAGTKPAESDFKAFFATGSYPYSTGTSTLNGIQISYFDAGGGTWSTSKGTMDQTGSVFKIEEIKESKPANQVISLMATFTCKVYDDNGNSKTLSNGKFVGNVENN